MKREIKSFRWRRESYWERKTLQEPFYKVGTLTSILPGWLPENYLSDITEIVYFDEQPTQQQGDFMNDEQKEATNELAKAATTAYVQRDSINTINTALKVVADATVEFTVEQRKVLHKAFATIVPPVR